MVALLPLLALAAFALIMNGARMMLADRRLATRLAAIAPLDAAPPALRLPAFLLGRGGDGDDLGRKLQLAGFQGANAFARFMALRIAATAGTALLILLFSRLFWGDWFARPLLLVIAPGVVFIAARQALHLMAAARGRKVTAEFPFLLDLMLMILESGVSLDQCFRSIAAEDQAALPHHGPLIVQLVVDLDRGMRYEQALDRWAARVSVTGAKELAALFRQAMFHGVELTPSMREFIREFTQRRVTRAREAMGGITVRMVVLMILFFMPALFIVLGGPPVAAIFDTLRGARS